MDDTALSDAVARAEQALERIERALGAMQSGAGQDEALREKVRAVVVELDEMLAGANG